jgi:hypothetical protein
MIIAAAVAIVCATFYFILAVRDKDIPEPIAVSPIQHLEDRKQAIYGNLRDLQFEYRLGKLSDDDYQQNKQALQKELAGVLAEIEDTTQRLDLRTSRSAKPLPTRKPENPRNVCPHCGAKFAQPLKFCGECGKSMA